MSVFECMVEIVRRNNTGYPVLLMTTCMGG